MPSFYPSQQAMLGLANNKKFIKVSLAGKFVASAPKLVGSGQ